MLAQEPAAPIKIGAIFAISGPASFLGAPEQKTAEMFVEQINQAGGIKALGGAKLKLVVADVTSTVAQGPSVVERTLSSQKISGAIGFGMSQMTLTNFVERELKKAVPAVKKIEAVQ